jgi:predicted regulator of Ras-like GTPase activity (Roadblock/LC7/MglB family)
MAVVSCISADALMIVLAHESANMGMLLYDLRRHRANIASLV